MAIQDRREAGLDKQADGQRLNQIDARLTSDEELCRRMGCGDEAAFLELYRPPVRRVPLPAAFHRSDALAEDVTQDVFIEFMDGRISFDASRGSLSALLVGQREIWPFGACGDQKGKSRWRTMRRKARRRPILLRSFKT